MKRASALPVSVRKPAFMWIPEGSIFEAADEAADLAELLGFEVEQPERDALKVLMAQQPNGDWATLETGIFCGRQNLKTWALRQTVLYDAFVRGVHRVTWSAHLYSPTTRDTFDELLALVENYDWLRKRVRKVVMGHGEESFQLTNGSRIDFTARSEKAARGLSGDSMVIDEAMFATARMMGALLPTLSAKRNPHIRYGSSPGVPSSAVARRVRDRGRSGDDPSLCYIEWTSAKDSCKDPACIHAIDADGCQLDNEAKWFDANPALGRRITLDYVRGERKALMPEEFMRERMGWWEDPLTASDVALFPADDWADCLDESQQHSPGADLVLAVDVSWDRLTASIAAAESKGDLRLVQVIAQMSPSDVREFLRSRIQTLRPLAIVVQGNGAPASTLVPDLDALGSPARLLHGGEMAKATGHLLDAIRARTLRHVGQPDVDQAIATALSRPLGDGWAIDRKKSPTDTAGLVAISEALWVLDELVGSADYDLAMSIH